MLISEGCGSVMFPAIACYIHILGWLRMVQWLISKLKKSPNSILGRFEQLQPFVLKKCSLLYKSFSWCKSDIIFPILKMKKKWGMLSPSSHREKWQNWQNLVLSLFFIMLPYNDCGQVFSAIFFAQYSDITLFSTVLSFFFFIWRYIWESC